MTHGTVTLSEDGKTLTMTVKGKKTVYVVERLDPDTRVADPAYRLTKEDGTIYDVHQDCYGVHCNCGDAVFRRHDRNCKHCRACIAVGLFVKS